MTLDPCTVCQAPAGWQCASCGLKCADHVRRIKGPRMRFRCTECSQDAGLLRRRRSELHRFQDRLKLAFVGPLANPRVLVAMLGCALAMFSVSLLSFVGVVVALAVVTVLGLRLVRTTAEGEAFDWPPLSEGMEQIVMPLARALAATVIPIAVLFGGVYVMVVSRYDVEVGHVRMLAPTLARAPSFWLAALFAVLTVPMMLLNVAVSTDWMAVLNPVRAFLPVRRFVREFGWITLLAGAGFLATFLVRWGLPRGFIGTFVASLVASYAAFTTFRVLGELVWLNPEEFSWGAADEGWVELDDPGRPQVEDDRSVKASTAVSATVSFDAQMMALLDNRDARAATRLFKETPGAESQLPPATLLRLGQAAATVDENAVALTVLLGAGAGDSPEGAKALVIAARILDERMRDQDGAKRLYTQVTQRFPGTQAAEFARKQLADPRFFLSRKG